MTSKIVFERMSDALIFVRLALKTSNKEGITIRFTMHVFIDLKI